jgi:hypothetical protein
MKNASINERVEYYRKIADEYTLEFGDNGPNEPAKLEPGHF